MTDAWEPDQYGRFRTEREAPFEDLVALIQPLPGGRIVDLGCGEGRLTAELHRRLGAAETLGVDRSAAMLERAPAADGLRFRAGDLGSFEEPGAWDLIVANASLHWVPSHPEVLARWRTSLRPGGQLAVQLPSNADHPSHRVLADVAAGPEFAAAFPDGPPPDPVRNVLRPEAYAEVLYDLGFAVQHVRLQVYGHVLASTGEVVEWLKGSSLTRFRAVLDDETYARLVERYRAELLAVVGDRSPYFYAFKRVLVWGRLP